MGMTWSRARCRLAIVLTGAVVAAPLRAGAQNGAPPAARPVSAAAAATLPDARADSVYSEMQVEKTVLPLPGPRPTYPGPLSAAHVQGNAGVEFVVDTLGRPEPASFRVVETSNPLFADAVREALPGMRFRPAELHGRRVRQRVQQPSGFPRHRGRGWAGCGGRGVGPCTAPGTGIDIPRFSVPPSPPAGRDETSRPCRGCSPP